MSCSRQKLATSSRYSRVAVANGQQEAVLLAELYRQRLPAGEEGAARVDGVARRTVGDPAPLVRGMQKGERGVEDSFFRSGGGQDFRVWIEGNAMTPAHKPREGLAKLLRARGARVPAD